MADDLGERTEQPTARRFQETRDRGQVARSTDFSAAVELIGGVLLLVMLGAFLARTLGGTMRTVLVDGMRPGGPLPSSLPDLLGSVALRGVQAALPFLAAMILIAWLTQVVQTGFILTTHPLIPKLDRLDPIKGLGRIFSRRNLVKSLVNALKIVVVIGVSYLVLSGRIDRIVTLPMLSLTGVIRAILELLLVMAGCLLAVFLVIGVIDFIYQRWQHVQDLRMTRQQVQDERRAMEGDPQVKGRRLRMARDIAQQRVNRHVPEATVVVTNPTHFSVAIRYDQDSMRAPRVVAKGVDFVAMRIRLVARLHDVPIVERPPLARGLYYGVEEGREIPPEFYQAVAEVLAFVYRADNDHARTRPGLNTTEQASA
ncbi:MAG: flagellar biosynthesis protein FlhB [Phycisphaeraceae bacterium]|nr:flagellar biosynthesis protein FlhB [Phycisphaeraceae bacterium]